MPKRAIVPTQASAHFRELYVRKFLSSWLGLGSNQLLPIVQRSKLSPALCLILAESIYTNPRIEQIQATLLAHVNV